MGAHSYKAIPTGDKFLTQDGTTVPQISPLAYSNVPIEIIVPDNAEEVVLKPTTAMLFSEDATMTRFFTLAAGEIHPLGVNNMDSFFIVRSALDGDLNFYFITA